MPCFLFHKMVLVVFAFIFCKTTSAQTAPDSPVTLTINGTTEAPREVTAGPSKLLLAHHPAPGLPGIFHIKYALKTRGTVHLQILDKAGHPLRTLLEGAQERGSYTFEFDPAAFFLTPGSYLYRLESNGMVLTKPIEW